MYAYIEALSDCFSLMKSIVLHPTTSDNNAKLWTESFDHWELWAETHNLNFMNPNFDLIKDCMPLAF